MLAHRQKKIKKNILGFQGAREYCSPFLFRLNGLSRTDIFTPAFRTLICSGTEHIIPTIVIREDRKK